MSGQTLPVCRICPPACCLLLLFSSFLSGFFNHQADRPDARQRIAAHKLRKCDDVFARLVEIGIVLQQAVHLASIGRALSGRFALGIEQIERSGPAEPFAVGKFCVQLEVHVLAGECVGMLEIHVHIVEFGRVGHREFKIQRIAVSPDATRNVMSFLEKNLAVAGGKTERDERKKDKSEWLHDDR